jgi:STE24 endopeptidase
MQPYAPARFSGEITHSLVFFFLFGFIDTIVELPLSYYHHFVLEEKFGFNKMTTSLWLMDKVKGQLLTIAFGAPIGAAILSIIKRTGQNFFYYLWLFTLGVSLIGVTIYPILIVPLFNKLTPLEPGKLKDSIDALAAKLKFPLGELQVIDGSKRSSHSNAYFTGLPWKKKIVLYDTLLTQSSDREVEAVLAHELGHWSMSHTTKLLAISQFHVFYIFALFSAFVNNKSLYRSFGFTNEQPVLIGFMLFNEVFGPTDSIIKLGMNVITRTFEFQAGMLWHSFFP